MAAARETLATSLEELVRHLVREEMAARMPAAWPPWMTLLKAADYCGRSRGAMEHLVRKQTVPSKLVDGRRMVSKADLDDWLEGTSAANP